MNSTLRIGVILAACLIFTELSFSGIAPPTEAEAERMGLKQLHSELSGIKKFYAVRLYLESEVPGLEKSDLSDYAHLTFRNAFAGYPLEKLTKQFQPGFKGEEWGSLRVRVWTVGRAYPVAFYVSVSLDTFGGTRSPMELEILGSGTAKELTEGRKIKNCIANLMEDAASRLLKVQDKM